MQKLKISKYKVTLSLTVIIILLGLVLRLAWPAHNITWSYDQARDSFITRNLIKDKNLILVGPQTEYYGLFHGPLYYYFIAPFYTLSKGEPLLPLIAMTILVYSSVIPLCLLAIQITRKKVAGLVTLCVFTFSYAFIEYSRWLTNFSTSLPFLGWSYYFLYQAFINKRTKHTHLLLGLSLGLASQGELFLLSFAFVVFCLFIFRTGLDFKKKNSSNIKISVLETGKYILGLGMGLLPLLIAEIKFGFRGAKILFLQVLGTDLTRDFARESVFYGYFKHIGLSMWFGFGLQLKILSVLLFVSLIYFVVTKTKVGLLFIFAILFSHFFLFWFTYVDAVFLDLQLYLLLVVIISIAATILYQKNKTLVVWLFITFLILQLSSYKSFLVKNKPFNNYMFIQNASTLSEKEEILSAVYKQANGQPFTFASFGTPFGVRTVWASVFEIYSKKHSVQIPKWYGYYANGYEGETILQIAERPEKLHVIILESNYKNLVSEPVVREHMGNQDTHTTIIQTEVINDTIIQYRTTKN